MPEIYRESQGLALAEIHAGQLALFENGALQMDSFQVGNHETAQPESASGEQRPRQVYVRKIALRKAASFEFGPRQVFEREFLFRKRFLKIDDGLLHGGRN